MKFMQKGEITHSKKDWMQTLLDRDNEFRARHGVESLQVNREVVQIKINFV